MFAQFRKFLPIGLIALALVVSGSGSAPNAAEPAAPPAPAVADAEAAAPSGRVDVLLIGLPDEDTVDAITGKPVPGVQQLKALFGCLQSICSLFQMTCTKVFCMQ